MLINLDFERQSEYELKLGLRGTMFHGVRQIRSSQDLVKVVIEDVPEPPHLSDGDAIAFYVEENQATNHPVHGDIRGCDQDAEDEIEFSLPESKVRDVISAPLQDDARIVQRSPTNCICHLGLWSRAAELIILCERYEQLRSRRGR